jgi:hypothetical protein
MEKIVSFLGIIVTPFLWIFKALWWLVRNVLLLVLELFISPVADGRFSGGYKTGSGGCNGVLIFRLMILTYIIGCVIRVVSCKCLDLGYIYARK